MTANDRKGLAQKYLDNFPALTPKTAEVFASAVLNLQEFFNGKAINIVEESGFKRFPASPFFMDLEITTACQLRCDYCARTLLKVPSAHMEIPLLEKIVARVPNLISVNLVGLGEPTLHPQFEEILKILKGRKLRVNLVTNGLALDVNTARMLLENRLDAITFSLDSLDQTLLQKYRKGSDPLTIIENIRTFMAMKSRLGSPVTPNLFCVLHHDTIGGLGQLGRFAASVGIPAIVVSDLNFESNRKRALAHSGDGCDLRKRLLQQMREVASAGVALLSPHILDTPLPEQDWPLAILKDPLQLFSDEIRSHNHCVAPWRTLVVRVDGTVNPCNCSPDLDAGNLSQQNLEEIWNGEKFRTLRSALQSCNLPASCRICPRL